MLWEGTLEFRPVAPPAGAWIETVIGLIGLIGLIGSRPPRARGLKRYRYKIKLAIPGRAPRGRVD